jgi:hypothetical protein
MRAAPLITKREHPAAARAAHWFFSFLDWAFLLAFAAVLVFAFGGCQALFEGTKMENAALTSETRNYALTPELAAVAVDLKLQENTEVVVEEIDPATGNVAKRTTTTTNITRGLPVMTESATVAASEALADSDTDLLTSATHGGNMVDVKRNVRGRADLQQLVTEGQVARTRDQVDLLKHFSSEVSGLGKSLSADRRDVDIKESDNATAVKLKELEALPEEGEGHHSAEGQGHAATAAENNKGPHEASGEAQP